MISESKFNSESENQGYNSRIELKSKFNPEIPWIYGSHGIQSGDPVSVACPIMAVYQIESYIQ